GRNRQQRVAGAVGVADGPVAVRHQDGVEVVGRVGGGAVGEDGVEDRTVGGPAEGEVRRVRRVVRVRRLRGQQFALLIFEALDGIGVVVVDALLQGLRAGAL